MKKMNSISMLATLGFSVLALNGCGSSAQIVKTLKFSAEQDNGHLVAGFDAMVTLGQGALPDIKLPIYDPKAPARTLGYIETSFDGTLGIRVDVTEATKIQVTDGTLLPNGREIPITLPAGVTPIAIPVINSNSKVYVAVGAQNIMAGVAVTLLAGSGAKTNDWLAVLQALPANIFYPFQLNTNLKGTAGVFTGEKLGVGVFAVQTLGGTLPAAPTTEVFAAKVSLAGAASSNASKVVSLRSLAAVNGNQSAPSAPEVFGVHTQYPTGSKYKKIQRALAKVRDTKLD